MGRSLDIRILIIGDGGSGKDTLAELLFQAMDLKYQSSSRAALDIFLYDILCQTIGYSSKEEAYADRYNHRLLWKACICTYNRKDPAKLCRKILERHNIYTGLRSRKEFNAAKHLFDLILWVDRDVPEDLSNELKSSDAHYVVDNTGTLEDLKARLSPLQDLITAHSYATLQKTLF